MARLAGLASLAASLATGEGLEGEWVGQRAFGGRRETAVESEALAAATLGVAVVAACLHSSNLRVAAGLRMR